MENMEKLLRLFSDMERLSPRDKLSGTVMAAAAQDAGELNEWELDLVSAAGGEMYQKFLRRLDEQEKS